MHLNSTNGVQSQEKEAAFWLMSPWQLHNSWIVLANHLSFANRNSGCVRGGRLEIKSYSPLLSLLFSYKLHSTGIYFPCLNPGGPSSLSYEDPLPSLWTLRSAHLNFCMLILSPRRLSVGDSLAGSTLTPLGATTERRVTEACRQRGRSFAIRSATGTENSKMTGDLQPYLSQLAGSPCLCAWIRWRLTRRLDH